MAFGGAFALIVFSLERLERYLALLYLPIMVIFGFHWQRYFTIGERTYEGSYYRVAKYVLFAFLIWPGSLILSSTIAFGITLLFIKMIPDTSDYFGQGVFFSAIAVSFYLASRLGLLLPAKAIGNDISFPTAWRLSAGAGIRIFVAVYAAILLPFNVVIKIINKIGESSPDQYQFFLILVLGAIQIGAMFWAAAVLAGFYASFYAQKLGWILPHPIRGGHQSFLKSPTGTL
jgi:hypothetical protein